MTIPRNLSFLAEGASSTGVLSASYGGTGLSSLTTGYIPFGNGTGAYSSTSNLFWDGNNFLVNNGYIGAKGGLSVTGTSSPSTGQSLEVSYGAVASTSRLLSFDRTSSVRLDLQFDALNTIFLNGSGSNSLKIFSSGGVSIGNTTDPGAGILSVTGGITSPSRISSSNSFFASSGASYLFADSGAISYVSINSPSAGAMRFQVAATSVEAMRIAASGGVSIGNTTDPGATNLSVTGTTTGSLLKVNNAVGTTQALLEMTTGWNSPSGNKSIIWKDATNTLGRISVSYLAPTANMSFGSLYNSGYQTSDLMTLFASGGLSIGNTTDPGATNLSVTGTVKIGTTLSNAKLQVSNNGAETFEFLPAESSNVNATQFYNRNTSTWVTNKLNAQDHRFFITGGEQARISNSGGLSVGTTTDAGVGNILANGTVKTGGYTVATLPTGVTGARAYVTNALAPSYGATVVGGGSVTIPVFYNGTNWIVA
jgi:hypothetical protein